jgi:hypothetical protein
MKIKKLSNPDLVQFVLIEALQLVNNAPLAIPVKAAHSLGRK